MKNLAVLTGGGDCPGLNAVIRAIYRTAVAYNLNLYGIKNGFRGLIENQIFLLTDEHISGILPRGGTILGTTNRDNPFHYPVKKDNETIYQDVSPTVIQNLHKNHIDALIVIGGDGTLKIAHEFSQLGIPLAAVPKTIDNDLPVTERTFGFDTAVSIATEALDRLHTTAESHHRVMILEVMGRYAGWIALHSGIAGGADCILIPEIPFHINSVVHKIQERQLAGKNFSIIVAAEGAKPVGGEFTVAKTIKDSPETIRLGGIGNKLVTTLEKLLSVECRSTVLGHLQRGGSPTAFDRILATRYGEAAVTALLNGLYNHMVTLQNNQIIPVDIAKIVGKPNFVPLDHEIITTGRAIGICFGD